MITWDLCRNHHNQLLIVNFVFKLKFLLEFPVSNPSYLYGHQKFLCQIYPWPSLPSMAKFSDCSSEDGNLNLCNSVSRQGGKASLKPHECEFYPVPDLNENDKWFFPISLAILNLFNSIPCLTHIGCESTGEKVFSIFILLFPLIASVLYLA